MNKERVFSDRLNLLDSKLDKILEILTADKEPMDIETPEVAPLNVVELVLGYIGLHELHDKKQLMELFEETQVYYNGGVLDPDETAWCAAFVYAICQKASYDIPFALNARAFANVGEESDGQVGDIAVWGSHVAVVMGYADAEQKCVSEEEWSAAKVDNGNYLMVGGGNQSNMVNVSPKKWYDQYSEFISYRKLV